jgi:hypothetical protein
LGNNEIARTFGRIGGLIAEAFDPSKARREFLENRDALSKSQAGLHKAFRIHFGI